MHYTMKKLLKDLMMILINLNSDLIIINLFYQIKL
jgi:hypothetical protein